MPIKWPGWKTKSTMNQALKNNLTALGNWLAAFWLVLATLFFLLRFTAVFYRAHAEAIDEVVAKLATLF